MIAMSVLAVASLAIGTRRPAAGTAIAAVVLGAEAALVACSFAGVRLTRTALFPDAKLAVVVGVLSVVAIYGLARRRFWGRWLGLALGATALVSGGLNELCYWKLTAHVDPICVDWSMDVFEVAWLLWLTAIGGAVIVANLAAARGSHDHDATWSSSDRLIGLLRATIIAAFAAGPMLLVYAWLQPIVPATKDTALVLAVALALGGALAVRGKLVGALVLVVAGLGLVAQTAATVLGATAGDQRIAAYYAVFWLPAGALAIACGVRLARPLLRLLR